MAEQGGFGLLSVLLITLILVIVGGAGAYIYRQNHRIRATAHATASYAQYSKGTATTPTSNHDPYAGWKLYSSDADHISIKCPPGWILDTKNAQYGELGYDSATLTSPSKTVLNLYANTGGKGGGCTPAAQDVPFRSGNVCPTVEYLTSEKLGVDNLYYYDDVPNTSPVQRVLKRASVYVVTTHYADQHGVSSYGISIAESTTPDETLSLNTPYMGPVAPNTWLTVYNAKGQFLPYVYVYASGNTPSFLTSDDATTIKNIVRSFTLDI